MDLFEGGHGYSTLVIKVRYQRPVYSIAVVIKLYIKVAKRNQEIQIVRYHLKDVTHLINRSEIL